MTPENKNINGAGLEHLSSLIKAYIDSHGTQVPTITLMPQQVVSVEPPSFRLTDNQYNIMATTNFARIDCSNIGMEDILLMFERDAGTRLIFSHPSQAGIDGVYVYKTTKIATLESLEFSKLGTVTIEPEQFIDDDKFQITEEQFYQLNYNSFINLIVKYPDETVEIYFLSQFCWQGFSKDSLVVLIDDGDDVYHIEKHPVGGGSSDVDIYQFYGELLDDIDPEDEETWVTNQKLADLVNYLITHKDDKFVVQTITQNDEAQFFQEGTELIWYIRYQQDGYYIELTYRWFDNISQRINIYIPKEEFPISEGFPISEAMRWEDEVFMQRNDFLDSFGLNYGWYEEGVPYYSGEVVYLPDDLGRWAPYICYVSLDESIPFEETLEFWDWFYEHFRNYDPTLLPQIVTDLSYLDVPYEKDGNYLIGYHIKQEVDSPSDFESSYFYTQSPIPEELPQDDGDYVLNCNITDGETTYTWEENSGGGGGGEPRAYIKDASVSNNTLTLTKKDNTTVTFSHQSLSDYRTSSAQDVIDATKQPKLTAGTNITIDENNVISANNEPTAYIKSATTSSNTLTLTNKNNTTVTYTPTTPNASTSIVGGLTVRLSGTSLYIRNDGGEA